ncbi:hypothetical protein TNCV_3396601 [Trichonephila clavipes]|nr:hypothetical protein TNCV_3396601 [Trichonephila clavipes]
MSYPVRLLNSSPCDMWPGIVLLEYRVSCVLQEEQIKRLHNLCDAVVPCQIAVYMYQKQHVMKHCATANYDVRCGTGLTLGEMG